ncbi:MAG: DUF5009 domain-containing protein [Bacteroidota bacterium]
MDNLRNKESAPEIQKSSRLLSIDAFRGLTILAMIFVNDLAGIRNIPAWMKHQLPNTDGMTFVDVVFPAFLFIVGMAIPLAIQNRLKKGDTPAKLWGHIFIRGAGLLALGLMMLNIGRLNETLTGMNRHLWGLLMFLGVALVWNQYPGRQNNEDIKFRYLYPGLRIAGFILLGILLLIYRSGTPENPAWMHTAWWGILGLIGWAYLTCCAVYFIFKGELAALVGVMAFFILLYIGDNAHAINIPFIQNYLSIGAHIGGHSSIALAGMITVLVITSKEKTHRAKMFWLSGFVLILFLSGLMLRPLYGIDKNMATPTWCLYSSAISCIIYMLLYWLTDVKKYTAWTSLIKPAGSNPLLAYILPDIFYMLLTLFHINVLSVYFGEGITGIVRSVVFSFLMVLITAWFTKKNVRLHL